MEKKEEAVGLLAHTLTATPPGAHKQVRLATHDGGGQMEKQLNVGGQHSGIAAHEGRGTLSRRDALKVGAAGLGALLSLSHITPAIADELARLAGQQPMTGPKLAGILRTERTR
jgi:hypothetical protein